jgi:hypothetical protein
MSAAAAAMGILDRGINPIPSRLTALADAGRPDGRSYWEVLPILRMRAIV